MKALSFRQLRIARSLAATLFDDGSGVPADRLDFAMGELQGYAARAGRLTRLALRFAFWVLQLTPLFLCGIFRRFTSVSADIRQRCVGKLEGTRLGLVVVLLKTVLSMVYFEHPDALASTGYDAEGLLGPAWAQGSASPVAKLRVLPTQASPVQGDEVVDEPVPAPRILGGT